MAFDVSNFVIDRVIRGAMTSTADGSIMYFINQITNPQLSFTADSVQAVDALGTTIQTYYRAKNATLSAENSMFDLGLLATQQGTQKHIASAEDKIVVPGMENIQVPSDGNTVKLKFKPTEPLTQIYLLKGDSTLGEKFTVNASATATQFAYDEASYTITLPTSVTSGEIFVMYDYETENAVEVVGSATEFPKAGRFVMEVLGNDVCDPTTLIYAYVIFPNAKLDPNTDITLSTESTHPFTLQAQQAYCDRQKVLFKIVIPELD